jgi:2-oxo-4-hydroxy-4-carboxy--5-ureidoimidazoline (OHCU) decarboxylase
MPEFTPLQLKLNIKDHHDLGINLVSNHPVDVEWPRPVTLLDRIPRTVTSTARMTSTSARIPSTPTTLPPISSLPTASVKIQINALDLLFESSTDLHTLVLPTLRPKRVPANPGLSVDLPGPSKATIPEAQFTSYASLIRHVDSLLVALSQSEAPGARKKLHIILGSHPRLGAKKVDSAQSQAEQAQLNTGGAEEAEKLKALNEEYETRFPGLRYVVFVNGRSRPVIMEDMRRRIDRGDISAEEKEAIRAMVDIALDRAKKLEAVASAG